MTDTSKEALAALVIKLREEWLSWDDRFNAADTITALRAERDKQIVADEMLRGLYDIEKRRAEAAEAREQALLSTYDAERKALVENVALRAENKRLIAALDKVSDDLMRADMQRITAEARITELERDVRASEAAALERAAEYLDTHAVQSVAPNAEPTPIGDAGWKHVGMSYARVIRALKSPDAATSLDAVRADARRAERNKALRDAADRLLGVIPRQYHDHRDYRCAILAMIETEGK